MVMYDFSLKGTYYANTAESISSRSKACAKLMSHCVETANGLFTLLMIYGDSIKEVGGILPLYALQTHIYVQTIEF